MFLVVGTVIAFVPDSTQWRLREFLSSISSMNNGVTFRHEVQFYLSDSALVESFARAVAVALSSGNAAIVVATKSHRESLNQKLAGDSLDIDAAIKSGLYIVQDADEMLSRILLNDALDRLPLFESLCALVEYAANATKTERPRVVICGEGVGILCAGGNLKAAMQIEELCNDLAQLYEVEILCAYPLNSVEEQDSNAQERIAALHTASYHG